MSDTSEAIFGSFDGMTSVLGVMAGAVASPKHVIVAAAIGLAVASAVGMGAGEYLGDNDHGLREALVMAVATLVGTLLPILPLFILPKTAAFIVGGLIAVALTCVIAAYRKRWVETFAVLLLTAVAVVSVAAVTGSSG